MFKKKNLDLNELNNYFNTVDNIGKYNFFFKTIRDYISQIKFFDNSILQLTSFLLSKDERKLSVYSLTKIIKLKKNSNAVFFNLAVLYFKLKKYFLAKKYYSKISNFDQKKEQLLSDQAYIYNILRQKKKASDFYYNLLKFNKENYQAVLNLSKLGDLEDHSFLLNEYLNKENKDNPDLDALYFAYSHIFEEKGDLEESSKYIELGNSLRKNKVFFNENRVVNDINFFQKNENLWKLKFPYELDTKTILSKHNFIHVFILGLPRTGSTLLEQYLASDVRFETFGETDIFSRYFKFFFTKTNLKSINNDPDEINNYSCFYNSQFKVSKTTKFIINKMPFNYYSIGFIKKCLPNSIILLAKRKFEETGFSIYKNYFSDLALNFAYSQKDIIKYFEIYKECIFTWKNLLGKNAIYEIDYEQIVKDPQKTLSNFYKFYNIDFLKDSIKVNKDKIITDTASINQVDKEIYHSSLKIDSFYKEKFNLFYNDLNKLNF